MFCGKCGKEFENSLTCCPFCGWTAEGKIEQKACEEVKEEKAPSKKFNLNKRKVLMLIMSVITIICLFKLSLVSINTPVMDVELYLTDFASISSEMANIEEPQEGEIVSGVGALVEGLAAYAETPEEVEAFYQLGEQLISLAEDSESNIIDAIEKIKLIFSLLLAVVVITILALLVMVYAALKNKIKLYRIICGFVILVLAALCMGINSLNVEFISAGQGTIISIALLVASILVTFFKKEKSIAK